MAHGERVNSERQSVRTFIEEARRKQIVECAIEVLAEHGYQSASLARIAERAGVSKGVISYHFDGKEDLIYQIVEDYGRVNHHHIWSRVEDATTATEALTRYINASIDFSVTYRDHFKAVIEILFNFRDKSGKLQFDINSDELLEYQVKPLRDLLRTGQEAQEFRQFDAHIMALSIRGAVDNVEWYKLARSEDSIQRYATELTEMFLRAVRSDRCERNG